MEEYHERIGTVQGSWNQSFQEHLGKSFLGSVWPEHGDIRAVSDSLSREHVHGPAKGVAIRHSAICAVVAGGSLANARSHGIDEGLEMETGVRLVHRLVGRTLDWHGGLSR